MVFVLKSRACITLVKRAKIWFWCHPAGSIVRLAMRLLCLPRENTLWNKGGLAEMVVDKDILLIYAITHFHNFEQSQIAIGTNQLNTAKSKLLVVCQSLFFFFKHKPTKASKKLLHMRRVECLLLMKSKAAETFCAGYCETVSMLLMNCSASAGRCRILRVLFVLQGSSGPGVFFWWKWTIQASCKPQRFMAQNCTGEVAKNNGFCFTTVSC